MRTLLIGQAPGPRTRSDCPLYPVPKTSAGGRLQQLMGLTRYEYLERFDRMNLLFHFPGKRQNGDKFSIRDAKLAANAIRPLLVDRRVVLVGRNVANAFDLHEEFHEWTVQQVRRYCPIRRCRGLARIACIPHPSGRNHWYNDTENVEAARRFWEELLQDDKKVLSFAPAQRI